MRSLLAIPVLITILISCATGDTEKDYTAAVVAPEEQETSETSLVINEFAPKSRELNEFGEEADWIELFNISAQPLYLKGGDWTLTDDAENPSKYELPDTVIPARGHLLIWCDEAEKTETGILHANFKLAGNGETIYLFYQGETADEITYDDDIKKSHSYGREKDGSDTWDKFKTPTPGSSNALLENYAESL